VVYVSGEVVQSLSKLWTEGAIVERKTASNATGHRFQGDRQIKEAQLRDFYK
jgi:hypothetical protein